MENIYNIPQSLNEDYELYHLQSSSRKVLIISDVHVPYHDIDALNICYAFAKKQKVDTILLNGDIFDFYGVSSFDKDPRKVKFVEELKIYEQYLDSLQKTFPRCKIYFKIGNHELRIRKYVLLKSPELFGLDALDLPELLHLRARGIEMIESSQITMVGKLPVLHGHEIRLSGGAVNPARSLYLKMKTSCVCSHLHKTSDHTEKTGLDKIISTHSLGCLCHDDQTEILTDKGFVLMKNINKNTNIYEYNQYSKTLSLNKPIAIQKYDYNGDMIHFSSDRVDQLVTPEHKMLAMRSDQKNNKIMSAEELYNCKTKLSIYASAYQHELGTDIDYLWGELYGFIITDGTYRDRCNSIRIYQKTKYNRLKFILEELKIPFSEGMNRTIPTFGIPATYGKLIREENPIKNEISISLLSKNRSFLMGLYEGLIEGDGHRTGNHDYFATHHEECTHQFQELCAKIGYSSITKKSTGERTNLSNKTWFMYRCGVRKYSVSVIKKKEKIKYTGKVYDITTNSGFFVVRRNGKVSISGNCDTHPEYAPINAWNLGFGIVDKDMEGNYEFHNYKIVKGRVV